MKKLAVHLHIYYTEQQAEMLNYLKNLEGQDYDLFITSTDTSSLNLIKEAYPTAHIWSVINNGYDVGPFIDFLHHVNLDEYEYILKLHTKGKTSTNYTLLNGNRFNNNLWGRVLWDSMLSTPQRLAENIQIMENNPQIGLLGSKYCMTAATRDYNKLLPKINTELQKLKQPIVQKLSFVAGTMFLVRANRLKPLLHYQITDFAPTDGHVKEGTLAHVVERIIGIIASPAQTISHQGYGLYFAIVAIKRFLFQKKITSSGKNLIKICKIPVYSKLKTIQSHFKTFE